MQEELKNSYTFMSRYRDVHVIKAASMSSPRVNAASVYFNGSLWVTGGQSNAGILDTTEWYIFAQDKWIQGPTLPMVTIMCHNVELSWFFTNRLSATR